RRGARASFDDLAAAFSEAAQQDLRPMFAQWVTRAGAPELRIGPLALLRRGDGSMRLTGVLEQVQKAAPFALDVPLIVRTANGVESFTVASAARRAPFELALKNAPLVLEVDPQFDLFRVLDARETAPSLGQLFGDPQVIAVLPAAASPQLRAAYDGAIAFWRGGGAQQIDVRLDNDRRPLPADRSIWVFGRDNQIARRWFAGDSALGWRVDSDALVIGAERVPLVGHSAVIVRRHPQNIAKAVAWVLIDPPAAAAGLARKLPHYGKYSYLAFVGEEPANTVKGEWAVVDSPLQRQLVSGAPSVGSREYPPRPPLARLPAVFDAEALQAHVNWLADPAREGRGLGTAGLDAAGDYIAAALRAAGLSVTEQRFDVTARGGVRAVRARNIIGVLTGSDPRLQNEAIIVSAHYDHLGREGPGVRVAELGQIHAGADDNASGVAVLIELARTIAAAGRPPRTLVFIAFSAEENGLEGSKQYVANPTPLPLNAIRAVVNLDTVGRLGSGEVQALATGSASEWPHIFRGITFSTGIPTRSIPGAAQSSDQHSFIARGIPAVQLFTGAHADYHRPSDTPDKIDIDGLVKVATVAREAVEYLAQRPQPLTATIAAPGTAAAAPPTPNAAPAAAGSAPRRVSFGLVPDFAHQGGGVRADAVLPGSPAALAGLQSGDVVLALDGQPIGDLAAFAEQLKRYRVGDTVRVTVRRDGRELVTPIELAER
ncbi:MAG: M20/M25/M40 family metallo-hydrolase, partial [Steroidobacteraceae bacterium]|nr:M20/M25/M40 family metallo-hydrolase [Steroidobacteraceae bacterium]MDW8258139.1 M20/M25/M40 family metallo-hydrolase [Gammaproteobacteria bacterium]